MRSHLDPLARVTIAWALALSLAFTLAMATGCVEPSDQDPDAEIAPTAATAHDVEFRHAEVVVDDQSLGFCPFSGTTMQFVVEWPGGERTSTPYTTSLDRHGQSVRRWTDLGTVRTVADTEFCAAVSASNWTGSRVCRRLGAGDEAMVFPLDLDRGNGCRFVISLEAEVKPFGPRGFCTSSCARFDRCGREHAGCIDECVADLADVQYGDEPVCHNATRAWIECLHDAPCDKNAEAHCGAFFGPAYDQGRLFATGQCPAPIPPPPPGPDPNACGPAPSDLIAGMPGDMIVLARTTDFADKNFLIVDLAQLGQIDDVLRANRGDASLDQARSVTSAVRSLDGTRDDYCGEPGIVALRVDVDPSTAAAVYALLDTDLAEIQSALEDLGEAAAAIKRQIVSFIMDDIVCPAAFQLGAASVPSRWLPPAQEIAGFTLQGFVGCFTER